MNQFTKAEDGLNIMLTVFIYRNRCKIINTILFVVIGIIVIWYINQINDPFHYLRSENNVKELDRQIRETEDIADYCIVPHDFELVKVYTGYGKTNRIYTGSYEQLIREWKNTKNDQSKYVVVVFLIGSTDIGRRKMVERSDLPQIRSDLVQCGFLNRNILFVAENGGLKYIVPN